MVDRSTAEISWDNRDLRVVRIWDCGGGGVVGVGVGRGVWRHLREKEWRVGERRRRGVCSVDSILKVC